MNEAMKQAHEAINFAWQNMKPLYESNDEAEWDEAINDLYSKIANMEDKTLRDLYTKLCVAHQEYVGLRWKEQNNE